MKKAELTEAEQKYSSALIADSMVTYQPEGVIVAGDIEVRELDVAGAKHASALVSFGVWASPRPIRLALGWSHSTCGAAAP